MRTQRYHVLKAARRRPTRCLREAVSKSDLSVAIVCAQSQDLLFLLFLLLLLLLLLLLRRRLGPHKTLARHIDALMPITVLSRRQAPVHKEKTTVDDPLATGECSYENRMAALLERAKAKGKRHTDAEQDKNTILGHIVLDAVHVASAAPPRRMLLGQTKVAGSSTTSAATSSPLLAPAPSSVRPATQSPKEEVPDGPRVHDGMERL
ncbi:unnamed protein product [Prorocentrum cordatum]|uniref:Uncharacterized protein n=1 Tax=Prorocentrum cordatum TaxID=2364126 RepID=A0ABN9T333_9DINO|nr:unnamed protein product [Polarella glacialis]